MTTAVTDALQLASAEILSLIGCAPDAVPDSCQRLIREQSLPHRPPTPAERDAIIRTVLGEIHGDAAKMAGAHRQRVWEQGWAENLEAFKQSGFDERALAPRYTHPGEPIRLRGDYAIPLKDDFELTLSRILRSYLFATYLGGAERIYEFGCGTGINLTHLAELFPDKQVVGLDWVESSAALVRLLGKRWGGRIAYRHFNFFQPEPFPLGRRAGVLTVTALEQVHDRFHPFVDWLLTQRPAVVVHVEPLLELYDEALLFDYLGAAYHRRRKYLAGLLTYLRTLEADDRITIERVHKTGFGVQRHDPFSYLVWRPC